MKVWIVTERCKGHQNCVRAAPDLFTVDSEGFGRVVGDGQVPPALQEQARLAHENCPEFAIELEVDTAGPAA